LLQHRDDLCVTHYHRRIADTAVMPVRLGRSNSHKIPISENTLQCSRWKTLGRKVNFRRNVCGHLQYQKLRFQNH